MFSIERSRLNWASEGALSIQISVRVPGSDPKFEGAAAIAVDLELNVQVQRAELGGWNL